MQSNSVNVGDWISRWASLRPEKTALHADGRSFDYRLLHTRTLRAASFLYDLGIRKGDRVGVLLYNSHEYLEIYFALSRMGAILVPLNWRLAPSEMEFILADSGASLLFFGSQFSVMVEKMRLCEAAPSLGFVCVGGMSPAWARDYEISLDSKPAQFPPECEPAGGEDANAIIYTSGTTGTPKGAVLSHRKAFFNVLNANIFFNLAHEDVMLVTGALFHSAGLLVEVLPTLYKGGTLVMSKKFKPVEMLRAMEQHKVTVVQFSATTLRNILEQCDLTKYDLTSAKRWFTGGERVPPTLIYDYRDRGITVTQTYGLTETSTVTWLPMADAPRKTGSVGIPVFHGDVKVVHRDGREVRAGEIGEIIVSGPIIMSGYWGKPELTEKTVREGWLHTGDLAAVDEEGFLYVVDREQDMFVSGNEYVYPAEIEKVYLESPKILNVAAVGVPDGERGEVPMVFIVLKEAAVMSEEEALTFADGKLARYKMPKLVKFAWELPMTATHKVKRNKLREAYLEEAARAEA